ncbi:MAG: hypothetical protein VXZ72_00785 [Chlamydiota bacterium]|nr:hypothetical protein [Chlamydiota bacterium]
MARKLTEQLEREIEVQTGKEIAEPADLFELYITPNSKTVVPRRVDPKARGLMSRYFLSFVDGFIARMGGSLELYSRDNKASSVLRQEGKNLTISVFDIPVIKISRSKMSTPPIEVGAPGRSYLEMYSGDQKYYVYVTPTGKMGVRKTPPPKAKK